MTTIHDEKSLQEPARHNRFFCTRTAGINYFYGSFTPLTLEVQQGDYNTMGWLLPHDCLIVSLCNRYGQSALSIAITQGSVPMVTELLNQKDIEVISQDPKAQQPLLVALEYRQHESLQLLLQNSRTDTNMTNNHGQTLLHLAVIYDNPIAVEMLVRDERVNVNGLTSSGDSALLLAAKIHGNDQPNNMHILICLLSRRDIKIDQRDLKGRSVLWHAVNTSNWGLMQRLLIFTRESPVSRL